LQTTALKALKPGIGTLLCKLVSRIKLAYFVSSFR